MRGCPVSVVPRLLRPRLIALDLETGRTGRGSPSAYAAVGQTFDGAWQGPRREMDVTRSTRTLLLIGMVSIVAAAHPATEVAAQTAFAAPDTARRISLPDAIHQLDMRNLELRLARDEAAASDGRIEAAGAIRNPALAGSREHLSSGSDRYHETQISLAQTFGVGGQRGLRRESAVHLARGARARVDAERLRLTFEVHLAFVRAAAAEADLTVLQETTELFRSVEDSGRRRLEEGDISSFEQGRLQVERARYETLLAHAHSELAAAAHALTMLIAPEAVGDSLHFLPAGGLSTLTPPMATPPLHVALATAELRAEVRAAQAEANAANATLALQRRLRLPDFTLSAGFKQQADGFQGAVVGVSIPLPLWDRNGGGIAEAEASLGAARVRHELALRATESEIRLAWEIHRRLAERLRLAGGVYPAESAALLETARIAYAEGELSLLELLDAADAHRSAQRALTELRAEYLAAVYELERATGRLLETPTAPRRGRPIEGP